MKRVGTRKVTDEDIADRLKLLREIEALRESGQITEDERVERLREAFPAEPGRGSDSDFVRFDRYSCRQNTGDQSPHSFK